MFVGAKFYPVFVDSSTGSLVTELVDELSSLGVMHVIESHEINGQVKQIPQILVYMGP
jgi:hypothetical protein